MIFFSLHLLLLLIPILEIQFTECSVNNNDFRFVQFKRAAEQQPKNKFPCCELNMMKNSESENNFHRREDEIWSQCRTEVEGTSN